MNKRYGFLLASLLCANVAIAQSTLYQERFPNNQPELSWVSGDGVSQLKTATLSGNPSGDNTVGYVRGQAPPINLGMIQAGASNLKNYRVEAQVFLRRNASAGSGTNNGILGRIIQAGQTIKGYVLASDFDGNNRLRLQKFTGNIAALAVIRNWTAAEIPGGIPSASSWHKLALDFQGAQINAYYDGQLMPGSPFTDTESDSGTFGIYCFVGFDTPNDSVTYFDDVRVVSVTTAVDEHPISIAPSLFQLLPNYPNPFNPLTTIPFALEGVAYIQLEVLNLAGQKITTLAHGRWSQGEHSVHWNAAGFPSGTYVVRLQAGDQMLTRRMLLVK